MSHIVHIQTEIRDEAALRTACQRLSLSIPEQGTTQLFAGQQVTGLLVALPGWRYPVACDTATGQLHYDNYQGVWGEQSELDRLIQMYACEKAKLEARRRGYSVREQQLTDGSIQLSILIGDHP